VCPQATGEDWKAVDLSLSTALPTQGARWMMMMMMMMMIMIMMIMIMMRDDPASTDTRGG
jgi:hypothetical protein